MRVTEVCHAWAVYRMTLAKGAAGGNVVCEQREWEAIEASRPGYHALLHAGIGTEAEAEKLARGTAGAGTAEAIRKAAGVVPLFATVVPAPPGPPTRPPAGSPPRPRKRPRAA